MAAAVAAVRPIQVVEAAVASRGIVFRSARVPAKHGSPRSAGPLSSALVRADSPGAAGKQLFTGTGGNYASGNPRNGNFSAPSGPGGGQWRSFGGPNGNRGVGGGPPSQAGALSNSGGFHAFGGNRGAGTGGTARSFSGQGNEVWENSPAARNMVPKSQSLSALHNSMGGSLAANSGLRAGAGLSASSRFANRSPLLGNRGLSAGVNASNSLQPLRGSRRFGIPFGGPRGGGCWNCGRGFGGWGNRWGYGFGGGWGFGWGGLGFWGWDPFFYNPWWGWPAPGYGYYGYPNNYLYGYPTDAYPPAGYYAPDDNSPAQQDDSYDQDNSSGNNSNGNWITPNGPSPSSAQNSANFAVPVLIYMKNGAVYSVRDYWMSEDELNYILMDGAQHTVDLEQVDLPRTNTENAKSGVKFIFKSEPSIAAPAADNVRARSGSHATTECGSAARSANLGFKWRGLQPAEFWSLLLLTPAG